MSLETEVASQSVPSGDKPLTCSLCQRKVPSDEAILVRGVTVCATCKPRFVQSLEEGFGIEAFGVFRKKKLVILGKNTELPRRCFKCNRGQNIEMIAVKAHHDTFPFVVLLLMSFIFPPILLVQLFCFFHNRYELRVGLCPLHQKRIWMGKVLSISLFAISIFVWAAAIDHSNHYSWTFHLFFLGFLFLFLSLLSSMNSKLVTVNKITQHTVWLEGAGRRFRNALLEYTP